MNDMLANHAFLFAAAILLHGLIGLLPAQAKAQHATPLHRFVYTVGVRLNRRKRSAASLVWRGLIAVLLLTGLAAAVGYGLDKASIYIPDYPYALDVLLLALCMRVNAPIKRLNAIARTLRDQGEKPAIALATQLDILHEAPVDAYAAMRRAAEDVVRAFADMFVLLAAYLVGAIPAAFAVSMLSAAALFYGRATKESLGFGWAASRLWGGILWLPERVAALWLVGAALFAARCSCLRAAMGMRMWAKCPLRYQCVTATAAEAVGIALGGPYREEAEPVAAPWAGRGSAQAGPAHMLALVWLIRVATGLVVMALIAAAFALVQPVVNVL